MLRLVNYWSSESSLQIYYLFQTLLRCHLWWNDLVGSWGIIHAWYFDLVMIYISRQYGLTLTVHRSIFGFYRIGFTPKVIEQRYLFLFLFVFMIVFSDFTWQPILYFFVIQFVFLVTTEGFCCKWNKFIGLERCLVLGSSTRLKSVLMRKGCDALSHSDAFELFLIWLLDLASWLDIMLVAWSILGRRRFALLDGVLMEIQIGCRGDEVVRLIVVIYMHLLCTLVLGIIHVYAIRLHSYQ